MNRKYHCECPHCREDYLVDGHVQRRLVKKGCILCDRELTEDDFTEKLTS